MDVNAIFLVGIGKVSEVSSLALARKIFSDNKSTLQECIKSKNFDTSLKQYYFRKSDISEYSNQNDVDQLKETIKNNAFKYLETMGYDISKFDLEIPNFWLNEMQSDSDHPAHNHYGFNLSGTYYVDIPKNSGGILFSNPMFVNTCMIAPIQNYTPLNSETWTLNPEEGDMLFWKSDLTHSVPTTKFDGVRRSIAFDVLITSKS